MDDQHQRVVECINECIGMLSEDQCDPDDFLALVGRLNHYAEVHFEDEEALLKRTGYLQLAAQESSHSVYRSKVESYQQKAPTLSTLSSLVKFLFFWWMHHIQVEDLEYRDHLMRQ